MIDSRVQEETYNAAYDAVMRPTIFVRATELVIYATSSSCGLDPLVGCFDEQGHGPPSWRRVRSTVLRGVQGYLESSSSSAGQIDGKMPLSVNDMEFCDQWCN